ncbi:MAG: glycerol-3-phosphate dehydrogenase [Gallionellales bacterium RIFCSPHIGHO2_02_FULL_57_16]|nr:MAG: glycerol-3-phosphate dehydrogenase [Gallionellales bacterium RIFCSPHIGHO2_02_FULL_57_16]
MNITIIGAGAWGTALAISLTANHRVTLWARDAAQIKEMRAARSNQRYLPDIALPANLELSADLPAALATAELAIIAVPTAALRSILQQFALTQNSFGVVWVCKGFEAGTSLLPHQVAAEVLPEKFRRGVLSGPSFAQEVARGLPTALTLASGDEEYARSTAQALHHTRLRIYASNDVVGVEVGGAVKNVMAIASGICDGMGLGHNARAALLTRGLAEITRLGLKLGGRTETLGGLSGLGDLILTCTGDLSRNRQVGLLLAQQHDLSEILRRLGHVAEGVYTVREVHQLAQKLGVAMPICEAVYRILYELKPAAEMVTELLNRAPNQEFSGG